MGEKNILLIGAAALMLLLLPSIVSGEGQKIEKTDPKGDIATGEDDGDSPGFSFYLLMMAMIGTIMIFGYRRRRD